MACLVALTDHPLLLCNLKQLAYDANLLRVPDIRWLGVFTSDLEDFGVI
jgi:hypothetical protein